MNKKIEKTLELGGKTLTIRTGDIAGQASAAVMVTYGETVVLATVVAAPMLQDLGYFPLTVEYQDRLYAGGRIKGSRWVKREGRPSDDDILTARLIDRSIRPLFPSEYKGKDVQVVVTVLSVDLENSPDIPSAVAVSAALSLSEIPWHGPVGTVKVGIDGDNLLVNPTDKQMENSSLELVVSATKDAVVMIESGAKEVPEDKMLEAIAFAQKETGKIISFIEDLVSAAGKKKQVLAKEKKNEDLERQIEKLAGNKLEGLMRDMATMEAGYGEYNELKAAVASQVSEKEKDAAKEIFEKLFKKIVRKVILSGKRPDGRKANEIRELSAQVGVLPRTHGSAIFQRGQTQALTVATLGSPSMGQLIETAEGEEEKRYIHHYSMPPYSTGETGRMGSPSRREIGHGALAEKALLPVIPSEETFPYAVRVVSEVLSSNGSTSMASTCGSTLSLMDAGVPISSPVAGIAMGIIVEDKKHTVLTDIIGIEDGNGDMDFKVAGTEKGITALQLDVKTLNLTVEMLKDAFDQAKKARLAILDVMKKAIASPRKEVSQYAPKIKTITIPKDKIGELIGPGGKTIRGLSQETSSQIDVDEEGKVTVSSVSLEGLEKAVERIGAMTKEVQAGEIYEGEVKRIQPFGAFIEILPGKDGMVHVSDMSQDYVENPQDVVAIGDKVQVRVKEIDSMGRINLTMLLDGKKNDSSRGGGQGRIHGGGRDFKGHGRRDDRRRNFSGGRGFSGPHFPISRLVKE